MNRLSELKENRKLDNKGFSLVELIIVIAIMAVLIGVLAPQYLKYVEKSRQSADLDTIDQMISAVEIYSADPANSIVEGSIEYTAADTVTADPTVLAAFKEAGLPDTVGSLPSMKSKAYSKWKITFSASGITVTDGNGDDDATTDLKKALGR